jgi:uncharacterized membrane protein YcaP (DUF421 family)
MGYPATMSFLDLVISIVIIGAICWGVSLAPFSVTIKKVIYVVAVICILGIVLSALGLWDQAKAIQVPKL